LSLPDLKLLGSHEGCPYNNDMHWSSWSEFWSMGGYGPYVWGSYAVTFVLLALEVFMVIKRKRAIARSTNLDDSKLRTGTSKLETAS
jgi:heme exporter protein D